MEQLSDHPSPPYSGDLDSKSAALDVLDKKRYNYNEEKNMVVCSPIVSSVYWLITSRIVVDCSEAMGGTIRTVVMLLCESFEINLIIQ